MEKKKILYVTSHLPSYRFPQAGHKTARMLLEEAAGMYEVYLIAFVNSEEKKWLKSEDFFLCRESHFIPVTQFSRLISILTHPFLPFNTALRADFSAVRLIRKLIKRVSFEKAHFEFTAAAYYRQWIPGGISCTLSEHDVTYQTFERKRNQTSGLLKILYDFEYRRQKSWELNVLQRFDEIILHNSKDRGLLVNDGIASSKLRVIFPYVNPVFKTVRRDLKEKHTILFWGAMGRRENSDAVGWFLTDIFPHIQKEVPDAKLLVVGSNPPEWLRQMASENIIVTGFVEDPVPYFERARIAIAPLRLGAGIKVKVLECLSAGIPVVATDIGAEGIEKCTNLTVENDPVNFALEILKLLR